MKLFPFITIMPIIYKYNLTKNKILLCKNDKQENELMYEYLDKIDKKLDKLLYEKRKIHYINENIPNITNKYLNEILYNEKGDNLFKKYYDISTKKEGYTLNDILQYGIDNPNAGFKNCLVSHNKQTYKTYKEIYENYVTKVLKEDISKPFENESYSMIKSLTIGIEQIIENYFIEIDITTNRNLEDYNYTTKMSRKERKEVCEYLKKSIEELEDSIFDSKGRFTEIQNDYKKNSFLKDVGVYRDWPNDRLIYNNKNSEVVCLINEEDHLKLKFNTKEPKHMTKGIQDYFELLEKIEKKLNLSWDNKLGYLNCNPANLGTGTYFRLKVKIWDDPRAHNEIREKLEGEAKKDIIYKINKDNEGKYYLEITNRNPYLTLSSILVEILGFKDFLRK